MACAQMEGVGIARHGSIQVVLLEVLCVYQILYRGEEQKLLVS